MEQAPGLFLIEQRSPLLLGGQNEIASKEDAYGSAVRFQCKILSHNAVMQGILGGPQYNSERMFRNEKHVLPSAIVFRTILTVMR